MPAAHTPPTLRRQFYDSGERSMRIAGGPIPRKAKRRPALFHTIVHPRFDIAIPIHSSIQSTIGDIPGRAFASNGSDDRIPSRRAQPKPYTPGDALSRPHQIQGHPDYRTVNP